MVRREEKALVQENRIFKGRHCIRGWGGSSVGTVLASHAEGSEFNPQHSRKKLSMVILALE